MSKCPNCGLERDGDEPEYECVECGAVGFDCCVPGNNTICEECAAAKDEEPPR